MNCKVATLLLLGAAFLWGAGNVANKTVLDHLGPLAALGLRCLVGALVIAPFALREMRLARPWEGMWGALGLSLLFLIALVFQQVAFVSTSVTNASFLVNTCTIMTPLVAWVILKERPSVRILVAAIITLGGAFLMSGGRLSLTHLNKGDIACLVSAAFYAAWMVALGKHAVRHRRPFATSFLQFAIAAAIMVPASSLIEAPTMGAVAAAWREIIFLGVFSTGVAFALQTHAQQYVRSSTAAVLVSAESLFGAAGAFLLLGERTPGLGIAGGLFILLGIVLAATGGQGRMMIAHKPPAGLPVRQNRPVDARIEFRSMRSRMDRQQHLLVSLQAEKTVVDRADQRSA